VSLLSGIISNSFLKQHKILPRRERTQDAASANLNERDVIGDIIARLFCVE